MRTDAVQVEPADKVHGGNNVLKSGILWERCPQQQ